MRPYIILTASIAATALLISLLSGVHRRGVLIGSTIASVTAVASLLAMAFVGRSCKHPVNGLLAIVVAAFLLRLILISLGCALVIQAGDSVVGFVLAFFVLFFVYSAIEAAFVHSLRHSQGPTA